MKDEINWANREEMAARMVEQFGLSLARVIAEYDAEGRYDELVSGYREGRTTLGLKRDGLTVLENAPVPPPTHN